MDGLSIKCNHIKVDGKDATEVTIAVNGLSTMELAKALEAMMHAFVKNNEIRPAYITALEAFIKSNKLDCI